MLSLNELLILGVDSVASDVHLATGSPPALRLNGEIVLLNLPILKPADTIEYARACMSESKFESFNETGDMDFSYTIPNKARFRVNAFRQRGSVSLVFRIINEKLPMLRDLGLPPVAGELWKCRAGLILVTGPTGSGKSTTVAALLAEINRNRRAHIVTIEDPIEYLFRNDKCIVNQREVGTDSASYLTALKGALREDPDVIFIGEMRDHESISIALTAAETGHLVISTLHTIGSAKTIDRMVDVFPSDQQTQIRNQLSQVLKAVVSQRLVPLQNGKGRAAAFELMVVNPAIANNIRENKTSNINNCIQTSAEQGMILMERSLLELTRMGHISPQTALEFAGDKELLARLAKSMGAQM